MISTKISLLYQNYFFYDNDRKSMLVITIPSIISARDLEIMPAEVLELLDGFSTKGAEAITSFEDHAEQWIVYKKEEGHGLFKTPIKGEYGNKQSYGTVEEINKVLKECNINGWVK